MIYALLRDEMAQENGIHALQLRTLTPDEEAQHKKKEAERGAEKADQKADQKAADPAPASDTSTAK